MKSYSTVPRQSVDGCERKKYSVPLDEELKHCTTGSRTLLVSLDVEAILRLDDGSLEIRHGNEYRGREKVCEKR